MCEDSVALAQQWLEQLHHLADHGHRTEAGAELAQAAVLLGEARGKLERAVESLSGKQGPDVRVERV